MHPMMPLRSSPTTRVHPSDLHHRNLGDGAADQHEPAAVYTVWKRSSMGFQGTDGFCVYDAAGSLAFRVDNYSRRRKLFAGELLLMDGHGAPLLALRPQILSMRDQWNCYKVSEEAGCDNKGNRRQQLFSMKKCSVVQSGGDEVEVHMCSVAQSSTDGNSLEQQQVPSFRVQGSFWRRSCKIQNGNGEEVARITRKRAGAASLLESVTLGDDVFSLTVMPNVDRAMIMAFVVIMDRICQKPYTPLMCSSYS